MAKVYLTRRNLLTLLSKIYRKGNGEQTACTIIKRDDQHEKYPQTMGRLYVVAVEYGGTFAGSILYMSKDLLKTLLSELDKKKEGNEVVCVVIKEAHPKPRRSPKIIEVFALENQEYYAGWRLPGDVNSADDPDQTT